MWGVDMAPRWETLSNVERLPPLDMALLRHLHPDLEISDLIFIPLFLRENPGLKMEVAAEVCALHEGVGEGSANSSREEPRGTLLALALAPGRTKTSGLPGWLRPRS